MTARPCTSPRRSLPSISRWATCTQTVSVASGADAVVGADVAAETAAGAGEAGAETTAEMIVAPMKGVSEMTVVETIAETIVEMSVEMSAPHAERRRPQRSLPRRKRPQGSAAASWKRRPPRPARSAPPSR